MPKYDWKPFLLEFSRDILADEDMRSSLPGEVVASGWLGFPGATENELAEAEARLGVKLPPSYREFLSVTNGWVGMGAFIERMWSASEIEWYRVRNQQAIDAWTMGMGLGQGGAIVEPTVPDRDYFVYGEGQDSAYLRTEYLSSALEISDWGDSAILLLNPRIVTPDGEWEAWFHASWLPGANRYRSFWEMMHEEHAAFLEMGDG